MTHPVKCFTRLLLLLLGSLLLCSGCTQPAASPADQDFSNTYGVVVQALPKYQLTPPYSPADYPLVFEENGRFGYKDKHGQVLLAAEYDGAQAFYRGYGQVYQDQLLADGSTARQWFYVAPTGKIIDCDAIYGFYEGQDLAIAVAQKDGQFGLLNSELEAIIPLEYDIFTANYDKEQRQWVSYGQKDHQWVQFDLAQGLCKQYEPYDASRQASYSEVIALDQYPLAIVNGFVIVNGQTDRLGSHFPLAILDGLPCQVYDGSPTADLQRAQLTQGFYEGELMVTFAGQSTEETHNYFATLPGENAYPRAVTTVSDYTPYASAVEDFLAENHIERTPYVISTVLTGDFLDNGQEGALLAVSDSAWGNDDDTFRAQIDRARWSSEKLKQAHLGVFTTLLYFPDVDDLSQYRVLRSMVNQENDIVDWAFDEIIAAAQLYGTSAYEVLIIRHGYEYVDITILDLAAQI